jgi:hypothetical protein
MQGKESVSCEENCLLLLSYPVQSVQCIEQQKNPKILTRSGTLASAYHLKTEIMELYIISCRNGFWFKIRISFLFITENVTDIENKSLRHHIDNFLRTWWVTVVPENRFFWISDLERCCCVYFSWAGGRESEFQPWLDLFWYSGIFLIRLNMFVIVATILHDYNDVKIKEHFNFLNFFFKF